MKQNLKIYIFILTSIITLFIASCHSTKPFSYTLQSPLNYAYDSLIFKDTVQVNSIRMYKEYIDSLIDNDDNQNYVVRSITEGRIKQITPKTSRLGNTNKIQTSKEIKNGEFGKYTYLNQSGDTIFKILYHDNIDKNFYESFYFKDNKLIFASIKYEEDGIGKTFYSRQEYYFGDKLLHLIKTTNEITEVYKKRVAIDLKQKGNNYLKEYFNKIN